MECTWGGTRMNLTAKTKRMDGCHVAEDKGDRQSIVGGIEVLMREGEQAQTLKSFSHRSVYVTRRIVNEIYRAKWV